MKNWFLPLAVVGLSGVGLLCASERGREQLRAFFDRLSEGGDPFDAFDRVLGEQLETIQQALDQLTEALEASPRQSF